MDLERYLESEWVRTIGCTEPASIAYAAGVARRWLGKAARRIQLEVDQRTYKNCYAIGIPHTDIGGRTKTGIVWAAAIGASLKEANGLECFKDVTRQDILDAEALIKSGGVFISKVPTSHLYIDLILEDGDGHTVHTRIEETHTNLVLIERDGEVVEQKYGGSTDPTTEARRWVEGLDIPDMIQIAQGMGEGERARLKEGKDLNLKISRHGLQLFPHSFVELLESDPLTNISGHVCAGVYARMWGASMPVMSVAGSGNKGITLTVPISLIRDEWGVDESRQDEALLIGMLYTSKITSHLGSLSTVCGCSNAAGIGLAAALTYMRGGGEAEISRAVNNMVGNITGMICDGAKIGCALKTMTAVDAAFRATALAMSGVGIPYEDGIVGHEAEESIQNMVRIANGMHKTDEEILGIMDKKMAKIRKLLGKSAES